MKGSRFEHRRISSGSAAALAAIALGASTSGAANAPVSYRASVDAALERIDVRACVPELGRVQLRATARDARHQLMQEPALVHGATREPLARVGRDFMLDARAGSCFEYSTRIDDANDRSSPAATARIVDASRWLWRPVIGDHYATLELQFDLPAGYSVATPWPSRTSSGIRLFRIASRASEGSAQIALGRLRRFAVEVAGGTLDVTVLNAHAPPELANVEIWLAEAANAVATSYGRFPRSRTQVFVQPIGGAREAVPWGQVLRRGPPSVHFVVDRDRPVREFRDDWTAVHEFSHLFLPFVNRRDAWVSEGFASYFQNVLRARSRMLTPAQAWARLWAGFERGRAATDPRLTLSEATREMHGPGLMRVYWAGAALALEMDIELQRRTQGREDLGSALERLGACCLEAGRVWRGGELFERLDELAGTAFLAAMYDDYARAHSFPDVADLYAELGIEPGDDTVAFDGAAPLAALRERIDGSATTAAAAVGYAADLASSQTLPDED
jgi:hypothetical protein